MLFIGISIGTLSFKVYKINIAQFAENTFAAINGGCNDSTQFSLLQFMILKQHRNIKIKHRNQMLGSDKSFIFGFVFVFVLISQHMLNALKLSWISAATFFCSIWVFSNLNFIQGLYLNVWDPFFGVYGKCSFTSMCNAKLIYNQLIIQLETVDKRQTVTFELWGDRQNLKEVWIWLIKNKKTCTYCSDHWKLGGTLTSGVLSFCFPRKIKYHR